MPRQHTVTHTIEFQRCRRMVAIPGPLAGAPRPAQIGHSGNGLRLATFPDDILIRLNAPIEKNRTRAGKST